MQRKNRLKAIVAIAVTLALVLPGAAAFANVGTIGTTPNSENTGDIKNIKEVITSDNSDSDSSYIKDTELPTLGTIYVDDDADPDWYDETHVKTITEGITNASVGDTVYVYNGTYYDHLSVNKQLDLIGESRENVIINASGTGETVFIEADNVSFTSFTLENGNYGIYVYAPNATIQDCEVYGHTGRSLFSYEAPGTTFKDCISHDNKDAMYLMFSLNTIIENCHLYNNTGYGFYLRGRLYYETESFTITNSTAYNHGNSGLTFRQAPNSTAKNCTIGFCYYGISVDNSLDSSVENCTGYNSSGSGISVDGSPNTKVTNCVLYNNNGNGIDIADSPNSNFENCEAYNNNCGIRLRSSSDSSVTNCEAYENNKGIEVASGLNSNVTNCDLHNNSVGIYIINAPENSHNIMDCNVYKNEQGITIERSSETTLKGNSFYDNTYNFDVVGRDVTHFYQDIDTSNTVNEKPILYLSMQSNKVYDGESFGFMGMFSCSNIVVKNMKLEGVLLAGTTDSMFFNVTSHNSKNGFYLYESSNNDITKCNVYSNNYGIYFKSSSSNNMIHHNNFVNNGQNAYDACSNTWDDGSEGNHWSDYTGVDEDNNGIGDTPYNILGGSNVDNYPLMEPVLSAPELLLPPDGSVTEDKTPTFDWTDVPSLYPVPVTYALQVANDSGFAEFSLVINETGLVDSEYTPTEDMPADIKYYWKVQALVGIYNTDWSETWNVYIGTDLTPPTTPDLIEPVNGSSTTVDPMVFFDWNDAYDAFGIDYYTLQVATDDAFDDIVVEETPADSECMLPLATADDYYWRVHAVDNNGLIGDWTEIWMFTRLADMAPPTVELTYPTGGEYLCGTVDITWTATDDYTPDNDLKIKIEYRCGGDWQKMSADEENDGTYTWDTTEYSDDTVYKIRISTSDEWGNIGSDESYPDIIVDNTDPVTTVDLYPADPDGENDWYVSNVHVILAASDETSGVNYTMYQLNDDGWQEYDVPFTVTEDDEYTLEFYSVDYAGNEETVKSVDFKIDQTVPTIELTAEKIESGDYKLTATVGDETSGVAKVEFYLDDVLLGEVTDDPYEWIVSGSQGNIAHAVVYDNAGHSARSEDVTPQSNSYSQSSSSIVTVASLKRVSNVKTSITGEPLQARAEEELLQIVTDVEEIQDPQPNLDVGRVWLRGLLFRCTRVGNVNHAMAIRLHYIELTPTERTAGMVTMNNVIFKDSAYLGRMYEVGIGLFTYVIGFFEGGLEIL